MSDHEGHFLCRDILRGDDEVAFVFAAGRVEDYDKLAVLERVDGVLDAVEVVLRRRSIGWHLRAAMPCWFMWLHSSSGRKNGSEVLGRDVGSLLGGLDGRFSLGILSMLFTATWDRIDRAVSVL